MQAARDEAVTRFRQMVKARQWPQWADATAKLRELGASDDQVTQVIEGVDEVIMHGSAHFKDADVAWHVMQVLSVLIHQGYEMLSVLNQVATEAHVHSSKFSPGMYVVDVRKSLVPPTAIVPDAQ